MDSERLKNFAEKKFGHKARRIIENPSNIINELGTASQLLMRDKVVSGLKDGLEDFKVLLRMLKAWGTGNYKEIPWRTLWLSTLSVIYFVSVVDFIPDFILGVGFIDDFALISWVLSSIKEDLEKFKDFENQNPSP